MIEDEDIVNNRFSVQDPDAGDVNSMERSHLKRKRQEQTIKNTVLALFGIVALVIVIVFFGIQLLVNFSLLMEKWKSGKESQNISQDLSYIAPPVLNPMQSATNSATITVLGYSTPKQEVSLYVNGTFADKTDVHDDKSFSFKNVTLEAGQNDIKAKAVTQDNKQSDYSQSIIIIYSNKAPTVTVDSPQDGQTFSKSDSPIKISGTTDPGVRVTVNDLWAIVDDQGKFSYLYNLHDGDNNLKIEAIDDAGNKTSKEMTIKTK